MINKKVLYNLYLDESGSISSKDSKEKSTFFVVGGYLIKDVLDMNWNNNLAQFFETLKKKFHSVPDDKIIHRTKCKEINNILCQNITIRLFEHIIEANNENRFVYIYEDKPDDINSTEYYYINLVSILVIKTLFTLIKESNKNTTIELNVICASRLDKKNNNILRHINDNEIIAAIEEKVNELKLKYGITNANLNMKTKIATKYYPLVLSDYFCNTVYEANYNNRGNIKEYMASVYKITKDKIMFDMPYTTFDLEFDISLNRKDYYNIINKFIFYKKLSKINNKKYKNYADYYIKNINEYFIKEKHGKKNRYIKEALKSILENVECESNSFHDYNNIIDTYSILIDFCNMVYDKDKNDFYYYLIFLINVDKLSVYNHKDDSQNAIDLSKNIASYIKYINSDNWDIDIIEERLITYYNISSIIYWHLYDAESAISSLNKFIEDNKNIPDSKIASLYGTLGQTYIIRYYVTDDKNNFELAKEAFNTAIEKFGKSIFNIIRIYNYFMLLSIVENDGNSFILYLEKYLSLYYNRNSNIEADLEIFIKDEIKNDAASLYFIKRLLSFCNYTEKNEIRNKISMILLKKCKHIKKLIEVIDNVLLVDIARDYLLFCYNNKISENNYFIDTSIEFMKNISGLMNDLRKISLYAVQALMNNFSNYSLMIKIINNLMNSSEGYRNTFSFLDREPSETNRDKKNICLKIINKLYM